MFRPAVELAGMVRSGEISARELVEISLARIEQLDPSSTRSCRSTASARSPPPGDRPGDERPFAGVPIAIKNNRAVAGLRLTNGCALMPDYVADYDHNVIRRLREAGFVIVGTTTLPEYGILPGHRGAHLRADAQPLGPAAHAGRAPRAGRRRRSPAGMVPVAHGNDGGGSMRIPAACCGLVGLKPARGRISSAPASATRSLVIDGVLTRTVAETAAILDVLAGYEPATPPGRRRRRSRSPWRRGAATTRPACGSG